MWQEQGLADVILITTNQIINSKGALVMGRGAALEAARRYPALPYDLAKRIQPYGNKPYGVTILAPYSHSKQLQFGAFQVKHHWKDKASLELIEFSTRLLEAIARICSHTRFMINYPGIGNGGLTESQVAPIIKSLPDNVYVYKLPYKESNAD